jgi:predicted nucleic-acid-binding protein
MIGLDTNVLARYYIDDAADGQAQQQRLAAQRLVDSGQALMVCKTVVLELEWVLRGYYSFSPAQVREVLQHLIDMPHVTVEARAEVEQALSKQRAGLDFADALHHASYRECKTVVSFDDKGFARRAKKLALAPVVVVPK